MNIFSSPALSGLLGTALVGTVRPAAGMAQAFSGSQEAPARLVAELLTDADDLALPLLRAAGVAALCARAGVRPAAMNDAPPDPAADESRPEAEGAALSAHLERALSGNAPLRLPMEACRRLHSAGLRLPAALLPAALDAGRRSTALRPALEPVLGERGRWLAALNAEWRYACGTQAQAPREQRWQEGSAEQRRAVLREEREEDPVAARERLTRELPELAAKERAELLPVLMTGLCADDEPLLAGLLKDRSREVRQAALRLLLCLPGSAHSRRITDRLAPLLAQERVLLVRRRWTLDAPAAACADWKDDGLEAERPKQESLGERAWWLFQLVRQTPPGWWTQHTGMAPAELLAWAAKTDWREALLRGWRDAVFATGDAEWCEAVLEAGKGPAWGGNTASLLALLPLPRRERHWTRQLAECAGQPERFRALAQQLLAACPAGEGLSAEFSIALASALRQLAESGALAQDWYLRSLLPELGCLLHPAALAGLAPEALRPRQPDVPPALLEALSQIEQVLAARRAFHALPSSSTVTPS